jgi:ATP-dependent protease ClpP protease subunit
MKNIVFLIFSLSVLSAHAARIDSTVLSPEIMRIELTGDIAQGDAEALKQELALLNNRPQLILRLNSPGGSVPEGQLMIEELTALKATGVKLITEVRNGNQCGSMCLPIYLTGTERHAGDVSAFYFHGVLTNVLCTEIDTAATEKYLEQMISLGMNRGFAEKLKSEGVFATPSKTWFSGKDLFKEGRGFITKLEGRVQKVDLQCLNKWGNRPN